MPSGPAHADPASEPGDPVPASDWMSAADWEAWCDATAVDDEPPGPGDEAEEPDPEPGDLAGALEFASGGLLDALPGGGTLALKQQPRWKVRRDVPVDDSLREELHHRTHALPDLKGSGSLIFVSHSERICSTGWDT